MNLITPGLKAVEVENLSKRKGRNLVLEGVNLTVERGELVGLFGRAGAGKTTLLNILASLEKPDEGKVTLLGITNKAGKRLPFQEVGVWLEEDYLIPFLTIWQNLVFLSACLGIPWRGRKGLITRALSSAGIWEMRTRTIESLSLRERGIVKVVMATFHNPSLLLLDEPESELDSRGVKFLFKEVYRLKEERNAGILWASSKGELFENADRIAVLEKGKIVAFDTPFNLKKLIHQELYEVKGTPSHSLPLNEVLHSLIGGRYG